MKGMIALALAATVAMVGVSSAEAAQGCGGGFHRGPRGRCIPNRGYARPPVLVIGRHYPGRGYWDGRRYWQNRYRYHGGWRYR